MICQQCFSHNGMALKEEFEYVGKNLWEHSTELWRYFLPWGFYFNTHVWCFMLQRSVVLIATSWTRRERHAPRPPDSQNSVLSADFALNLLKHSLLPPQRHQRTVKVFHAADSQWPSLSRPHHISVSSCLGMCQSILKLQLESLQEERKQLLKSRHAVLKKSFTFIICMNECCNLFFICVYFRPYCLGSLRSCFSLWHPLE